MDDVLQFALKNGIIDLSYVQEQYDMSKKKELLNKHTWAISQGKDGYWRTYLPDKTCKNGRRMIKKRTKEDVEEVVIDYWKVELENPTIEEVFTEWNNRRLELKKISPATHWRNEKFYERHYSEFGKKRIKSIEPEMIADFLETQIAEHNLTSKAFAGLKAITKGYLKRAKRRKLIDFNVEELFQNIDVSDTDFKKTIKEDCEEVFSEEETDILIPYLLNHLDKHNMGILLLFATGIRVGELVTLKNTDFSDNCLKIRRTETRYYQDGKYIYGIKEFPKTEAGVRTVVIPSDYIWLVEKIKQLNPSGEYIFLNRSGQRMTTNCIRRRIKRVCEKLHICPKSPHKVRKTYGSILLDNHIDKNLVVQQMGHTDILCTENYYHRNRRNIERKSNIISSIPEFKLKKQQILDMQKSNQRLV